MLGGQRRKQGQPRRRPEEIGMMERETVATLKEFLNTNEKELTQNGKTIDWNEVRRLEAETEPTVE